MTRKPVAPKSIELATIAARHRARSVRVREFHEQNQLQTATDYSRAALLLQQGDDPEDYQLARKLNLIAISRSGGTTQPLQNGPEQDCSGAIRVCQREYVQPQSYTGVGAVQELPNTTCLSSKEKNSVWYEFTAQTDGSFAFTINTPNDYDYALYNITNTGCAGVQSSTPIRCNYSGANGPTGLDLGNVQPELPAISSTGSTMIAAVYVTKGQTYALLINNFSNDQNGYTLTFSGTASIFGPAPPEITGGTLLVAANGESATATWNSAAGGTITVVAVNECGCNRSTPKLRAPPR
ncbi:MAG: hypothetical protein ACREEM_02870 [Blastocatellia bacterium]